MHSIDMKGANDRHGFETMNQGGCRIWIVYDFSRNSPPSLVVNYIVPVIGVRLLISPLLKIIIEKKTRLFIKSCNGQTSQMKNSKN